MSAERIDFRLFDPRLEEGLRRITDAINRIPADHRFTNEPRVFLVGGCVRDALLKRRSADLDLEVFGVAPERLESVLTDLFPERVNTVGRAFGILLIPLADDAEIDVSIPRRESKTAPGHRGFTVEGDPGMTVVEAARRRDFTINAIYADGATGEITDPYGGVADLDVKLLRAVDPKTFVEDPLRVYRAVQFAARFTLGVEAKTFTLMKKMVAQGALDELPAERITEELRKLFLKAEQPSLGLTLLKDLGIVERDLPELHALIGTPQEPEWHPEGDVWTHTLMVLNAAASISRSRADLGSGEPLRIMLGALCHDLGKPKTTKGMGGRIRSHGHEEAGKELTEDLLGRWTFGERATHAAVVAATEHLKPSMLYRSLERKELTDAQYENAIRRLLKRIAPVSWRVLIAVAEADHRGRAFPGAEEGPYVAGERFAQTVHDLDLAEEPTRTLLQGRDLIALGLPAGPRIGEIIERIETMRDAGDIRTYDEALAEARRLLQDE